MCVASAVSLIHPGSDFFFFKPGVGGENQSEIETQSSEGKKREWMRRR